MSIQRKLEVQVISAARQNRDNMAQAAKGLTGYKFTESALQWIWDKAKKAWDKGELIRFEAIEGQVRTETPDAHDILLEAIVEIWRAEPSTTLQTDCNTLKQYHRHDHISRGLDRATKALIRGDLDGATTTIKAIEAKSSSTGDLQVMDIIDFADWDKAESATRGIPTGIRTYDDVTQGGAQRGDLGVVFGVTNMGKSILATNFAYTAFKHGRRVLHIDTENGADECKARYLARATRLPTRTLSRRRFGYSKDFRDWAVQQQSRIHKYLRLLPVGVDQTSLEETKAKVQELIDEEGWEPDEIIFDSPDHLVTKVDSNTNMGYIAKARYESLKGWGQEFNAAVWVVTQSKAEAEGKIATNKNIAWGYDKARIADAILTINPGLDDKGSPMNEKNMGNKRSLFVAKARKSAGRFIVPLTTDFPTAYIAEQLDGEEPADVDSE